MSARFIRVWLGRRPCGLYAGRVTFATPCLISRIRLSGQRTITVAWDRLLCSLDVSAGAGTRSTAESIGRRKCTCQAEKTCSGGEQVEDRPETQGLTQKRPPQVSWRRSRLPPSASAVAHEFDDPSSPRLERAAPMTDSQTIVERSSHANGETAAFSPAFHVAQTLQVRYRS